MHTRCDLVQLLIDADERECDSFIILMFVLSRCQSFVSETLLSFNTTVIGLKEERCHVLLKIYLIKDTLQLPEATATSCISFDLYQSIYSQRMLQNI